MSAVISYEDVHTSEALHRKSDIKKTFCPDA